MLPDPKRPAKLVPEDEGMHANTGEKSFNESMYFNFFDAPSRRGGFVRVGNRPNEGHAEVTLCLFRPDGSVLFSFQRPEIADNHAFEAGGMRFRVEKPFERLHVAYDGRACHLQDPLAMQDPRAAFRANPFRSVRLELSIEACGPPYGGERQGAEDAAMEFARGHYEQHHRARGWIEIEGEREALDGFGLRDHSWGPRSWQSPAWYRWLTGSFGPELGFMASHIARRDGSEIRGGFVHRGDERIAVSKVEIESQLGEGQLPKRIVARLHGPDGRALQVEGRVLARIPLRNRRGGGHTRILESMTEWRCEGRVTLGIAEYLDQTTL